MSADLKERTLDGILWNFLNSFAEKVIAFVVGIVLARLLSPEEYGVVAMVTIFIVLTQPFVNSGFSQALIRKEQCSKADFSTVFYFNLLIGILIYVALFFSAPAISRFFEEPQLVQITRVIGLIIIIEAVSLIQITIVTKEINFKLLTKIMLSASVLSGTLGILLAMNGAGVWSLVYRALAQQLIISILLWTFNHWKPSRVFSMASLKELFGFGSKLLLTGLLDKLYFNLYNLVIAKRFSAQELGLYSRADMFKNLAAENVSEIIARVAFPAMSTIQGDPEKLKRSYQRILLSAIFIAMVLLFGMAAVSESLIITLIGEQWRGAVIYLQLLCFVGIFHPAFALIQSLLYVLGKSGLILRLEIFAKLMAIPVVTVGIIWGIQWMILAMILAALVEYLVKAFFSGRFIGYTLARQVLDVLPSLLMAVLTGGLMYFIGTRLDTTPLVTLLVQGGAGGLFIMGLCELTRPKEYTFLKELIRERGRKFLKSRK